jgi:outer membrane autotransporter protein
MQEDCDAVVGAAIQGDQKTASALRQITPETATKANFTTRRGGERQVRNLGSRISALRAGVRGFSLQGLDWRIDDQPLSVGLLMDAYDYGRQSGGGASVDNTLLTSKLGVFVTGTIGTGNKDQTEQESGLDFDTYGLTIGADYRITQQFILGGALGYIDTQTELDNNSGELDTQGYSLSFYGTYYHTQNYFLDFAATYGSNNFDQKRRIVYQLDNLADVNQIFSANYDGDVYSLFIGSGYEYNRGEWAFGPRLDLEYLRSKVDEFTEETSAPNQDGGGWATRVSDTDQTWLTFNLGGKVSYTYSASWGVMVPYARLDWLHEFKDDAQTYTAYFVNDLAGNAIEISTDDPDRNYMRLRIGTTMQFQNGIAGFIDYDTLLANSKWDHHYISLGIRMAF